MDTKNQIKKVTVLGLGYVGLPVAAVLASRAIEVTGVDTNPHVVTKINGGHIHIIEPDLEMLVQAAVSNGKLRANAIPDSSDAFVIAVPTPFKDKHEPNLAYVQQAVELIAPVLKKGDLIVLESTVPVGATESICEWIRSKRPDLITPEPLRDSADLYVAHCPERVLPGTVIRELVYNDRVIGGVSPRCAKRAAELYSLFVTGELHLTNARTAEMAKLVENAFRDVNIAFANELATICEVLGINVWELVELANHHPRVNILTPGPGVGGHCIAVDPWFIVFAAGEKAKLIKSAREVNDSIPERVVARVASAASRFKEPKIACFGLAYKANIDDLRESPALKIAELLAQSGYEILAVEPNIVSLPPSLQNLANVRLVGMSDALTQADVVALLVDHRQFNRIDRSVLDLKIVIDTRGLWRASKPLRYKDLETT